MKVRCGRSFYFLARSDASAFSPFRPGFGSRTELERGSKSIESKLSSSKGSKSQSKSSGKSAQAEEPVFKIVDTEMTQDQGDDMGNTEDQPNVEEASKHDWFKNLENPLTSNRDWNDGKQIDFRPPHTWIRKMVKTGKPPNTFDELMSTPVDFSAYVLHNLKTKNLTQEHLVGPAFNLLKGTCKSRVELEFHFEEFPANYFFNIDLEYLKGGSSSGKYITSTTKTKADKYDSIEGIEDMVQTLWSPVKVAYDKHAVWGTSYLDHKLYKFKEGDFPRLNLRDIEDMLLLLVQKKLSNLEKDDLFDLNMALQIITRRFVILKLMCLDELYKFCDGTLSSVRRVLHDIASRLEMYYLAKRIWSKQDRKRSRIMIKEIDQQLFEKRLMRNLEKKFGGREYGSDFRLLERTI
ncbi:hypothetical protein Tco_0211027 [Tanacetum coccineum]